MIPSLDVKTNHSSLFNSTLYMPIPILRTFGGRDNLWLNSQETEAQRGTPTSWPKWLEWDLNSGIIKMILDAFWEACY